MQPHIFEEMAHIQEDKYTILSKEHETSVDAFLQKLYGCRFVPICFHAVFELFPDGVVLADLKRQILTVNPAIMKIFGYNKGELIGQTTKILYADDEEYEAQGQLRFNLTAEEKLTPYEVRYRKKNGAVFDSITTGSVIKNREGNKVGYLGLIRDITEQKQAEKKLLELEHMYQTVADFTYDWETWRDLEGKFRYVSPSCERITGYNADEFINRPSLIRDLVLPDDLDKWDTHHCQAEEILKLREIQFRIIRKDGEVRWIEHACQPVIDADNELHGFRASNRDITTRKKTEEHLKSALAKIGKYKNQLETESAYLREEITLTSNYEDIIGNSNSLQYVLFKIEQIATTDTTILILGETGTGKELIARAIHNSSLLKEKLLIKVDCASLPANLIESELFGHERGSFTDAHARRIGRFETAKGSTIFLDEIGELPLGLQTRLLRVLQDGTFERVGGSQTIKADVRVIAATNRNLEQDVKDGKFRKDLWYRLNVYPITAPPLRDRLEDIPDLVSYFMDRFSRKQKKLINSFSVKTINHLQEYSWPGNIRELENVIERAVINSSGPRLQIFDDFETTKKEPKFIFKTMQEVERDYITQVLEKTDWKVSGKNSAAEILDLDRSTLRARMNKLGISKV